MFAGFAALLLIGAMALPLCASPPDEANESAKTDATAPVDEAADVRAVCQAHRNSPPKYACRIACECGPARAAYARRPGRTNQRPAPRLWKIDEQGSAAAVMADARARVRPGGDTVEIRIADLR